MLGLAHVLVVEVAVQLADHGEAVFQGWIPGATFCRCSIAGRLDIGLPLFITSPWWSTIALMM